MLTFILFRESVTEVISILQIKESKSNILGAIKVYLMGFPGFWSLQRLVWIIRQTYISQNALKL